jgi:Cu/Ag efflux protein CusF
MRSPLVPVLIAGLMAAGVAHAQAAGGRGHGGPGRRPPDGSAPAPGGAPAPTPRSKPADQIEIVGVVRAIDPAGERVTIAYDENDALNWPAGTLPFAVSNSALLKDVSIGEKVRFQLESDHISVIRPF